MEGANELWKNPNAMLSASAPNLFVMIKCLHWLLYCWWSAPA